MNDIIIIPQAKNSIIANIENDTIQEVGKINISFNSKSIITKNNLIVSLCFDTNMIKIHDLNGNLLYEKGNTNYKAINFKENTVYFGGEYKNDDLLSGGEMFSILDVGNIDFKINQINLPIKVVIGKSIDDILIRGEELILVDNIVYPKFLIKYSIISPNAPTHISTQNLPNNGTYEHIVKGDINDDWMVIFSSTVGRGGTSQHIVISGKTQGRLSIDLSHNLFSGLNKTLNEKFKDVALINSKLYILRTDVLGFIDLNSNISNKNFTPILTDISNISRIIKSRSDKLIAIKKFGYELIIDKPILNDNKTLWSKFKNFWS